jgi:fimbrial chaperone protein
MGLLSIGFPAATLAGGVNVSPIQIYLSQKTTNAMLTVRNDGTEVTRYQISAFAWSESPQGEMKLDATKDVIFFPTLLSLKPGEQRNIRVGVNAPVGQTEKTYRVFVEELPSAEKKKEMGVRILTKVGIPIFLQPAQMNPKATVQNLEIVNGQVSFAVKNSGNSHLRTQIVRARGEGEGTSPVFEAKQNGWYLLAGGDRVYKFDVPKDSCAKVKSVSVEVPTDRDTVRAKLDTPNGACGR